MHSTADDPSAYRPEEEPGTWEHLDPLVRLSRHACWRGIWDEKEEQQRRDKWEARVGDLIAACESWPPPPLQSMFEDVTSEPTPQLEDQRERYLRFHADRQTRSHDVP